jgi:uncharacterized protein (DUF885 family)
MTTTPATDAASDLTALADEAWAVTMAARPLYATAIGDHRYLETLPPNEPSAIDRLAGQCRGMVARAEAIPQGDLSETDRVTRAALIDELAHVLGLVESGLDRWTVDPLDGPQVQFLNVASYQPLATDDEGVSAVERWRAMGPWIDRQTDGIRSALDDGIVAPRALVDSVLDELDDLLGRPDEAWPLFAPAELDRPGWSAAQLQAFRDGIATAIGDGIRPAFERQRSFLADVVRPVARPDERVGLSHVSGGEEAYRRLVRAHTTLDLSAEEIHAIGLAETARIDAAFAELGGHVLGTSSTAETIDRLRRDPALRFSTSEEVRETAERSLRRATAAIPEWFGRLPQAGCDVVVMGEHESKHSTIAYYREPAADGSRPGRYYINTSLPETRPRYEAEALAFHESVPGHHLQIAIGQELTHLPAFRRFSVVTAFVEGWGLYTERLSAEMGLYSDPIDELGVLSFDAWRVCRLVVDTGMHALGWTRRQAIDFMLDHTALAENNIVNEVDRYIAIPGQALAYKLGQLELLRLRGEAEAALGRRFDIRRFHDAVLGEGAVGLGTLRGVIGRWIETSRDGAADG